MSREAVFSALFSTLQSVYLWQTCSRRLQNVQDMQPETLPAAFQLEGQQSLKYTGGMPTTQTWEAQWLLYAFSADPAVAPSTQLNAMVDAALAALAPTPTGVANTLGALVQYAAADGNIDIFEGVLGDRAIAVIPIRILVPGF